MATENWLVIIAIMYLYAGLAFVSERGVEIKRKYSDPAERFVVTMFTLVTWPVQPFFKWLFS